MQAICRRIVHEHGDHIIDAISTGSDGDTICKDEVGVCDVDGKTFEKQMELVRKAREEEAEKRKAEKEGGEGKKDKKGEL